MYLARLVWATQVQTLSADTSPVVMYTLNMRTPGTRRHSSSMLPSRAPLRAISSSGLLRVTNVRFLRSSKPLLSATSRSPAAARFTYSAKAPN